MKLSHIILIAICFALAACTKQENTPEGPTDVRIRNISDQTFDNVVVNTGGGENNYGTIEAGEVSGYLRFEKAYPKAGITVSINNEEYTTGVPDYTYATYIGPDMITYEVEISDAGQYEISIRNVILEGPIENL